MNTLNETLYIAFFIGIAGIVAVLFYMLGQLLERMSASKNNKSVVNSLLSNQRLAKELTQESTIHRRIADRYREAFDRKETYWQTVRGRWQEEADKAKKIISKQETDRTQNINELKESNKKLLALENNFQKIKRGSDTELTQFKSTNAEDSEIEKTEDEAEKSQQELQGLIDAELTNVATIARQLEKKEEKITKLEKVIHRKNNDLNELKNISQNSGDLEQKFKVLTESFLEQEKEYEAIFLNLKSRTEEVETLNSKLSENTKEIATLRSNAEAVDSAEDLKGRVFMNETQLLEKDQECKKLATKLDQTKHTLEQLKVDLNSKNQKLTALVAQAENRSEIDQLTAKVEEYEKTLAERDEQLAQLHQKHEAVEKSFNDQAGRIEEIDNDGSFKQSEIEKLRQELSGKSDALNEIHKQIQKLEQTVASKDENIEQLKEQVQDTTQLQGLSKKLALLQGQISEKDNALAKLEQKLGEEKSHASSIQAVLQEREQECNNHQDLQVHSKKQNNQINQLSEHNQEKQKRIDELESTLHSAQEKLTNKEHKIVKLNDQFNTVIHEKDTALEALRMKKGDIENQRNTLQTHVTDLEGEISHLKEHNKGKQKSINELEDTLRGVQDKLKYKENELDNVAVELNSLKQENDAFVTSLSKQKSNLENQLSSVQSQVAKLEEKISELGGFNIAKQKQIDEFESKLKASESALTQKQQKLIDLESISKQYSDEKQQSQELHKKISEYQKDIAHLSEHNNGKQRRIDEVEHFLDEKTTLFANISSDKERIEKQNNELQSELQKHKDEIDHLINHNNGKQKRIDELEHSQGENDVKLTKLKSKLLEKQSHSDSLVIEGESKATKLTELENTLNQRNAELESLRQQASDTSKADELNSQLNQKQEENNTKQQKISQLEHLLDENQKQITILKASLIDTTEIDSLKSMLTGKETLLSSMTQQMKDKQNMLDELEKALQAAHRELIEAQQTLSDNTEQEQLQTELENKSAKLDMLLYETVAKDGKISELELNLQEKARQLRQAELKAIDTTELELLKKRLEERDSHITFLDNSSATANMRLTDLEKHISLRDAEITKLQDQATDTSKLDDLLLDLQSKEQHLSIISADAAQSSSKVEQLETSLAEMKSSINAKDAELISMREEINDLNRKNVLAAFGEGNVEQHPQMGIIYIKIPNVTDNLQEIFGISEILNQQLNDLGVYRFKQVALWTESQAGHFQEQLNFEGSISREQWPKQAQRLTD